MTIYATELISPQFAGDGSSTSVTFDLAPYIDQTFHKGLIPKAVVTVASGNGSVSLGSFADNEITVNLGWTPGAGSSFNMSITLGF